MITDPVTLPMTNRTSVKKRCSEHPKVGRLGEMLIKSRREGTSFVLVTPKARQSNEPDTLATRMFSESASNLVAIHIRQTNIQEDNVGAMSKSGFEHLSPSVHSAHIVTTGLQ